MRVTRGSIVLPLLAIAVGVGLIYTGSALGWGVTWVMAGVFFITVGVIASLLNLAWILPPGNILWNPIVNIIMLALVVLMLVATVVTGIVTQGH